MIYIETGSTDVYYNFALEYYFTLEKRLPDTVFLFWRTTPTLMVGKYQNVLEEINKPYADAHGNEDFHSAAANFRVSDDWINDPTLLPHWRRLSK